uniref:LIM zinc-binding domain-containing protein n=1 Tax=Sinocyclocheilus anshuiensis TaxID=1608454 RepID=A0A671Q6P1_9TELE
MNPACARCGKTVYPTEKISCLDKNWHKGCFHCEVCKMTLNMKNYKGYDKKPYCNAHYPKTSFTIVTDTPENLRLKQQSELQSQVSVTGSRVCSDETHEHVSFSVCVCVCVCVCERESVRVCVCV